MYNSYLGPQQTQGQQGYQQQPSYQVPQATGYAQPPPQQQQLQQQPFLQTQPTGYAYAAPVQQPNQYGLPPVPAIPAQYAAQTGPIGVQPTGYVPQQQFQPTPQPLQVQQPSPPVASAPTGHQRQTSTAMGTSARIPNGSLFQVL